LAKRQLALRIRLCPMSARHLISCRPTQLGLPARLTSSHYPLPVHRITTLQRWVPRSDSPRPPPRSGSRDRHRKRRRVHLGCNLRRSLRWVLQGRRRKVCWDSFRILSLGGSRSILCITWFRRWLQLRTLMHVFVGKGLKWDVCPHTILSVIDYETELDKYRFQYYEAQRVLMIG